MIGVELEEMRAIAVRVDDAGVVQAQAVVDADGDLAAAATSAVAQVAGNGGDARVLGLATAIPDAAAIMPAVQALAPRFDGPFREHGAIPSGTAAAVAVWWEWTKLVHPAGHPGVLVTGVCTLVIQALLVMIHRADVAVMIGALGALGTAIISAPASPVATPRPATIADTRSPATHRGVRARAGPSQCETAERQQLW